ncbi:MAG TPA: helix-turn-helix domain-containing protein [Terriglobales bacterium]|nr:helix-turn-helix domain-containing protein [Terriglobales bacterium]HXY49905.1 helix-turn-helix domain-containing protein [Terriglobales bacterium]
MPRDVHSLASIILAGKGAMTAKQLSEYLGISSVTLLRRARAGKLPSFRVGGSVRFDRGAICRWLQQHGVQSLS